MEKLNLNEDLYNIVKDKKVALIGPASYLQGKNLKKYFDDYDVVCRPNEIIPLREQRVDYGSKTNIMFCKKTYFLFELNISIHCHLTLLTQNFIEVIQI